MERLSGLTRRSSSLAHAAATGGMRRRLLALAGALAAAGWVAPALARTKAEALVEQFLGARQPASAPLQVELPELADNANAVPLRIRIDQAIDAQSFCEEIMVVAEKNPRPLVCRFRFTPLMGVVDVSTRIRLAETQHVTVLARMNDGRVLQHRHQVTATMGGCGG